MFIARSEKDIVWAMQKAGWFKADPLTWRSSLRITLAIVFKKNYPTAPFGTYYVFGRKQDLGFQIPIGTSPLNRHHVRFWRLGSTILEDEHEHQTFWNELLRRFTTKRRSIWLGAAIEDSGLSLQRRSLKIDHGVKRDVDSERDFLVATLRDAHVLKEVVDIKAGEPLHTRHQGFGETIIADGYVKLCSIKRQILPPPPPAP